jgi:hypothetical protein
LVIGFIGHFNINCDYTLQITITHRLVFSVTVFTAFLGSVFQQGTSSQAGGNTGKPWRITLGGVAENRAETNVGSRAIPKPHPYVRKFPADVAWPNN